MLPNIKAGNVCSLPARTPTSWSREEGKGVCVYAKNVRKERETQCRKGGGGGGGGEGAAKTHDFFQRRKSVQSSHFGEVITRPSGWSH